MVALAKAQLEPFGERAKVYQTDGALRFDLFDGEVDRFVATYVLDLLSEKDIRQVIKEAYRVLGAGGLLCLTSSVLQHAAAWPGCVWVCGNSATGSTLSGLAAVVL